MHTGLLLFQPLGTWQFLLTGCTGDCPVAIEHNELGTEDHYDSYNAWAVGDDYLDWTDGAESGQVRTRHKICKLNKILKFTLGNCILSDWTVTMFFSTGNL